MIGLFCNNEWLDMPPDSNIRIEMVSSLFESELLQGSYSFPFDIPRSPVNLRALSFPNTIEAINRKKKMPVQLYWHGVKRFDCLLNIQQATKSKITVNLVVDLAGLEVLDKKLPEFDYGGERFIGDTADDVVNHANAKVALSYPATDYNFPSHWNPEFYGDANPDFQQVVNRWDMTNLTFVKNVYVGPSTPTNQNTLVPWPYLQYVMKTCFLEAGYTCAGDFFTDTELQQLMIYSNYSLDDRTPRSYVRASLVTPQDVDATNGYIVNYADDTTLPNKDDFSLWSGTHYDVLYEGDYMITVYFTCLIATSTNGNIATVKIMDSTMNMIEYRDYHFPQVGIVTFSYQIPYTATPAEIGNTWWIELSAVDGNAIELTPAIQIAWVEFKNISDDIVNRYARTLNVANHVPDITFGELIKAIRNVFNLSMSIDSINKQVVINQVERNLKSVATVDLTDKRGREHTIEYTDVTGFTFGYNFPSSDNMVKDNFKTYNTGQFLGSYATYPSLPPAVNYQGKVALVKNLNKLYIATLDVSLAPVWEVYADNYYDYIVGDGDTSSKAAACPLFMTLFANISGHALMPAVKQRGQTPAFAIGADEFTDLRIMFWRGMQTNIAGQPYPHAGSTIYRHDGWPISGATRSLVWDGAEGIFEMHWKNWIAVLMRGEFVRLFMNLNIIDLLNMTEEKKRIGYLSFLLRRVSTTWGKSIGQSEVEMYQV